MARNYVAKKDHKKTFARSLLKRMIDLTTTYMKHIAEVMPNVHRFDLQSYMDRLQKATSETEIEEIKLELAKESALHLQSIEGVNYSANIVEYLQQINNCADRLLKAL
jgi:isopenicillin N synthase-like dioxygenase